MKISFVTKTATEFTFQGNPQISWDISTVFALNTEKIVAWSYSDDGELHLWFQGVSESLCLREDSPQLAGKTGSKDNFLNLLLVLRSEFKEWDEFDAISEASKKSHPAD